MRVLYSYPDRLGKPTGGGAAALHQVDALGREGVAVTMYCASMQVAVLAQRVVTTMALGNVRVPHRAVGIDRAYRYHDWRVARALRQLRGRIDLVHCWPKATLETAQVARRLGVKVVREVINTHTAYAFDVVARENAALGLTPPAGHSHTFNADVLEREEAEYRAVDRLLIPSDFAMGTFLQRGFELEHLALHANGFNPSLAETATAAPPDEPFTALYAARCEPRKGLHHALRAWLDSGAAEHGRFIVLGEFVPGYRDVVTSLLDHPSVEEHGFVSDLGAVMRESHIFVLPSIEDGSALVTYDAQACGCVLVVSQAAGARCEHMRHGLIHRPGDVQELTEHIRLLHRNRGLLSRMRAATLAHLDALSWDHAAKELVEIYRECLASNGE